MKPIEPTTGRPTPGPSMESTLVAEVEHCAKRLALAEQMLKEWRLSHSADTKPTSVYETRGFVVMTDDDDDDLPGGTWHTHHFNAPQEPIR